MNSAENLHRNANVSVSSVLRRSPVLRISKPFLSKFITASKGEMFGFPRLRTLVAKHGKHGSLEEALLEELYSFVGEGWEQEDDITLLTLKRSASLS